MLERRDECVEFSWSWNRLDITEDGVMGRSACLGEMRIPRDPECVLAPPIGEGRLDGTSNFRGH